MASNSSLDQLLGSFFHPANFAVVALLPYLVLRVCGLWLSLVGWLRHRVIGFLFFAIASVLGTASLLLQAIGYFKLRESAGMQFWFSFSSALSFVSTTVLLVGIGHLAYRTKCVPLTNAEFSQP